jgi:hypothetical protein
MILLKAIHELFNKEYPYDYTQNIHEFIAKGYIDCDIASILTCDVGRNFNLALRIIFIPGHAFVISNNFIFETTNQRIIRGNKTISDNTPIIRNISELNQVYNSCGNA